MSAFVKVIRPLGRGVALMGVSHTGITGSSHIILCTRAITAILRFSSSENETITLTAL